MEIIFEVIFQFLGELLLQIVFQIVAELGFHSLENSLRRRANPAFATIGYILWGLMAGGLSLWILPDSIIEVPVFRVMNLVATPVALGFLMMLIGRLRVRKGQDLVRLDQFGYAFIFAFAMAFVRFVWAA
ncbi:hypothetical protein [Sphingomonas sp.]|uniref:hypothetical protein n=1 Tax=Sphingomonas sp. TaxID=28214 RepID=UPI0025E6F545|nr:hypothetical protein [Sphingomonas sp.]